MNSAIQYKNIIDTIHVACAKSGREARDVTIVAVTKKQPVDAIVQAYEAGIRHFGENYIQEAEQKIISVPEDMRTSCILHMIGHVQKRKVTPVVQLFHTIDSVDGVQLGQKLNDAAASQGKILDVLVEVNVSGEGSKTGFLLAGWEKNTQCLDSFYRNIEDLIGMPHLRLHGIMTMPPYPQNSEVNRKYFRSVCVLQEKLRFRFGIEYFHELSMGTSGDYMIAIEEGATQVRLGEALFGKRV